MPKSRRPELEKEWDNFLLACTNCNSSKGEKVVQVENCLWPDRDDTFSVFIYEPSGAINIAAKLDLPQKEKAAALLALVGLDQPPEAASDADYRHKDRLEQWDKAEKTLTQFQNMPSDQKKKFLGLIVTESYSIWATVFRTDPVMLDALAKKFPGTKRY